MGVNVRKGAQACAVARAQGRTGTRLRVRRGACRADDVPSGLAGLSFFGGQPETFQS